MDKVSDCASANGKKSEAGKIDMSVERRCDNLIQIYIFLLQIIIVIKIVENFNLLGEF